MIEVLRFESSHIRSLNRFRLTAVLSELGAIQRFASSIRSCFEVKAEARIWIGGRAIQPEQVRLSLNAISTNART